MIKKVTNVPIFALFETSLLILCLFLLSIVGDGVFAWISTSSSPIIVWRDNNDFLQNRRPRYAATGCTRINKNDISVLEAKRNRPNSRDEDDISSWYDPVDDDATPDQIFFQEMERQSLINQVGGVSGSNNNYDPISSIGTSPAEFSGASSTTTSSSRTAKGGYTYTNAPLPMSDFPQPMMSSGGGGGRSTDNGGDPSPNRRRSVPTMEQIKIAEATLSEYELFRVSDNWLNEELQKIMWEEKENNSSSDYNGGESNDDNNLLGGLLNDDDDTVAEEWENSRFQTDNDEPWDYFGEDSIHVDKDRRNVLEAPFPPKDSEFYYDPDIPIDPKEVEHSEQALAYRMRNVKTKSDRLEKARRSDKAKNFFQRGPKTKEGYDHLWVAAVDNASYQPLLGSLRDYGVEFADNFGDFVDQNAHDGLVTIEDMASWKARQVYNVTGLPTIASRTSFEIEPIPKSSLTNFKDSVSTTSTNQAAAASRLSDPKVVSGYKINDIANHVDYLCDALKPLSEPERVTRFTSCLCYYDGEIEIFEHGVLDCALHFCNSMRTFIPIAQATDHMVGTVKMTFCLEYQKFLKTRMDDALFGDSSLPGGAGEKLRDRVLKDGKVLPNDIIDVSKFMDSQVDVDLMDACAQELSQRFVDTKPTKIMTVATTGLVIALPMARYLQVPVVYARKERSMVMADTYTAAYSSKTVGKDRQLLVSKSHVHKNDRVLIIDDFLSSGSSQEALLKILSDAGAEAVGIGVLLEKAYDPGRKSLSGYDIPIQSLCRIASVDGGVIQLVEEEGFDKIMK